FHPYRVARAYMVGEDYTRHESATEPPPEDVHAAGSRRPAPAEREARHLGRSSTLPYIWTARLPGRAARHRPRRLRAGARVLRRRAHRRRGGLPAVRGVPAGALRALEGG